MEFKRPFCNIGVIEAAAGCNLRCKSCVAWTDKGKDLVTKEITERSVELFKLLRVNYVQMYWRGDPCIHPSLYDINELVLKSGMKTAVSTNGVTKYCSNPDYMERLLNTTTHYAVCLDGYNGETLSKYRVGAKWERMLNNLEIASKIKSDCDKILSVLMFRYNEGKEAIFEEIANKYGFRLEFKAPNVLGEYILTEAEATEWLPNNLTYSRYDKVKSTDVDIKKWRGEDVADKLKGEFVYIHRNTKTCETGNMIIAANGDIPLCGQFTDKINGLGNIKDDFKEILSKYKTVNEEMLNRNLIECKEKCLCLVEPR